MTWRLLLICSLLTGLSTTPVYKVSGPSRYVVLSGDVRVKYEVTVSTTALRLKLVELLADGEQPLAKKDVPAGTAHGEVAFPCGLIQRAGRIAFKLVTLKEDSVLAETGPIRVEWPSVTVHVPLLVDTYSSDVMVQMYLGNLQCGPRPRPTYTTFVELVYEGPTPPPLPTWHEPNVLYTKELPDWLLDTSYDIMLDCEFFDRAGYYRVRIKSDQDLVAESAPVHVMWSPLYSVSVAASSVQPCDGSLSVVYHYPRCILDQDRIRVYGRAADGQARYLLESKVQAGKHATKLPCHLFGDHFAEYCFSFVSTARNGAVFDLDTHCLPSHTLPGSGATGWSLWSGWSECSASCGTGAQSRYRLCGEAQCQGKAVQSRLCLSPPCPEDLSTTTAASGQLPPECLCGCEMNLTDKNFMDVGMSDCPPDTFWIIRTLTPGRIVVDFQKLLFPSSDYWLTVRDGQSSLGPVLAVVAGSLEEPIEAVHSLTDMVRLELHSINGTSQAVQLRCLISRTETPRESLAIVQSASTTSSSSLSAFHVTIIMLAAVLGTTTAFLALVQLCRFSRSQRSLLVADNEYDDQRVDATSISDLSAPTSAVGRSPSIGPEDILHNSFLFKSSSSSLTAKKPLKSALKLRTGSDTSSPVRRRAKPTVRVTKQVQRESATPLTASVSELSTTGSDDGFEYDYYDYGCHQEPGSFFCPEPGWPPFIPLHRLTPSPTPSQNSTEFIH